MDRSKMLQSKTGRKVMPDLEAAVKHAGSGDWVEAAAAYARVVKSSNKDVGFSMRPWAVRGLCSVCQHQLSGRVPEQHFKLIKRVARGYFGDVLDLRVSAMKAAGPSAY